MTKTVSPSFTDDSRTPLRAMAREDGERGLFKVDVVRHACAKMLARRSRFRRAAHWTRRDRPA